MTNLPSFIWMILLPTLAAPLIYLSGRIDRRPGLARLPYILSILTMTAAWYPFILSAQLMRKAESPEYLLGALSLRLDGLSLLLTAVVLILGLCVMVFSGNYLARESGQEKFYAMLLLMVATIVGLGCATDLFNLWVWFEAMAISSYLLVAFYRNQSTSLEAGFKYLVQSATGSALVVTGIALVFGTSGTLSLDQIRAAASPTPAYLVAGALFLIGFGVKAALVPLHTWLPDAHSQAPSGISAMLSGVVIEAGLVAMLRSLGALMNASTSWPMLLAGFGAVNMLVGNLMALRQTQVKRMLAYSSVAHIGYMLLGLGITFYSGLPGGAQGSLFHLFNHGLMKSLAFLSAGTLLYGLYLAGGDHGPLLVNDLAGAARRYPLAAFSLSLAVLGLGGLPPLAGFMSKWQIFAAGFQTENIWLEVLVIFAALNSVLSLAYYVPMINNLYRVEPSPRVKDGGKIPRIISLPMVILGAGVFILGVWPGLLNWLTTPAAQVIVSMIGGKY